MAAASRPRPRYNVVIPTKYGMMIVNRNDSATDGVEHFGVGHDLMQTGEYMPGELAGLQGLLDFCPADPVILDIGANIGVHSLFFSEIAGPGGRVHAFEAQRIVFQMLMGNLALNSIENVQGYCVALGQEPGELKLSAVDYSRPWNIGGMTLRTENAAAQPAHHSPDLHASGRPESIPVISLDSLNLKRVDFIKLDVEGMEEDVLRGAARTLDISRPLMQVEWMGRDRGSLPLYLLEHLDYQLFQAGNNLICIPAERAAALAIHGLPPITADAVRQAFKLP